LLVTLAGCGFHLRGTADVPFQTLYLPSGIPPWIKR
jgi:outer membrane lipopolysaccharide assembly protein LptE/RlpB